MAKELSPKKGSRRAKRKFERKKLFSTEGMVVLFLVEITVR